jgi:hypothetical protein
MYSACPAEARERCYVVPISQPCDRAHPAVLECQRCVEICEKVLHVVCNSVSCPGSFWLQEPRSIFFRQTPVFQNIPLPRRRNSDFVAILQKTAHRHFFRRTVIHGEGSPFCRNTRAPNHIRSRRGPH